MASEGEKFLYFLLGGFVGVAVGLLLAPQSGEETRHYLEGKYRESSDLLNRKAQEGRELVTERSRDVVGKVTETVERSREGWASQKDQLAAAIEAGRTAYHEEKGELESEVEDDSDDGKES